MPKPTLSAGEVPDHETPVTRPHPGAVVTAGTSSGAGTNDTNARWAAVCWITVAILAAFLCFTQLAMMLSLLGGRIGLTLVAPAGLIGALFFGYLLARRSLGRPTDRIVSLGLALGCVAASVAVSAWYFDFSWDGEWYHQTAIYAIGRDWNPLTDPMREFLTHLQLWVRHYAKGPWYVAAALYDTTGLVEIGKCTTPIACAAMGLSMFAAALDWGLSRRRGAMAALLVMLNPVAMSELTSFLVDGVMIGFLVAAAAAMIAIFRRARTEVVWAGLLAAVVTINAKFTGLVFLCFVFAAGWVWCAYQRRPWLGRYTAGTAAALVLGAGVFGYNPYVTNLIHQHQPFYPVLGSAAFPSLTQQGREGIELYETPKNLMGRNRLVRLAYATFGRPGNAPYRNVRDAELMIPFGARPADLFYYRYHETRVAGFGPFFSGALLIAFALGLWIMFQPTRARWAAALVAVTLVGSILISPHLWWPRYGPQLWLLPIVPVVFAFALARTRAISFVTWTLAGLLLVNAAIVAGVRMTWETRATATLRRQLTEIRATGREIDVCLRNFEVPVGERLKAWGIPYRNKKRNELRDAVELKSVVEGYPGAVLYRVPAN